MGKIGETIADAAAMGPRYAERLVKDIPAEHFARLAAPGGSPVPANHPAFIFGHLCLYPVKVSQLLGGDTTRTQPPANFELLFSKGHECLDDPDGTRYPPADELLDFFRSSYQAAIETVRAADDESLLTENPVDSPMKQFVPTLGGMLNYYLTSHLMTHLGQLSTWRRMQGLPPA